MRMTVETLGALRKANSTLYHFVLPAAKAVDGKVVEIDLSKMDGLHEKLLTDWMEANSPQVTQSDPTSHGDHCGCNDCFQKQVSAIADREHARLEAEKAAEAGIVRLREYLEGKVPGYPMPLLDTPNNRAKFNAFVKEHADIPLGSGLVDQAVAALQLQLDWEKPVTLKDGRPQRRLDETPNHTWSAEQARDWLKRIDGQKLLRQQQYGGSSRSSWFKADSQVI